MHSTPRASPRRLHMYRRHRQITHGEEDFPVHGFDGDSSYYRGDDDEESDDAPSDDAVATH